ncbi:MAG: dockerin type I domain-containing protein [Acidobacteriota bacterium]
MKKFTIALSLLLVASIAAAQQPPCCFVGDVTADDAVTQADLTAIQQHILGVSSLTAEEAYYADVNGDGSVSTADLIDISKFINGITETFAKCGDLDDDGFLEYDSLVPGDDDDLVILREHILGINLITDPVVQDNADLNDSCTLSTFDSILGRKLELGLVQYVNGCTYNPNPCVW